MSARMVGTIYASERQLAEMDAWADRLAAIDRDYARNALPGATPRKVGDEWRYYVGTNRYATCRNKRVRWFEVRADGDYAVSH